MSGIPRMIADYDSPADLLEAVLRPFAAKYGLEIDEDSVRQMRRICDAPVTVSRRLVVTGR